jgi:hypothetical protein
VSERKTKPTDDSVEKFLSGVEDDKKREDCLTILGLMEDVTGHEPEMWGDSIVGFGRYHYRYESGREGEWFLTGFSPRRRNLTLYIMSGFDAYESLLEDLGKFTTGKSCLYIHKIEDVNLQTLKELVRQSVEHMAETND